MHYQELIKAHRLFYEEEHRAFNYDGYLACKDWDSWLKPDLSEFEIRKLFNFVKSWDRFYRGNIDLFQKRYPKILQIIEKLTDERLETTEFNDDIKKYVRDVFDLVANCTWDNRYESTDTSKILHTIIPDFFVMWDKKIRDHFVGGGGNGAVYAFRFLPEMQSELNNAVKTCMDGQFLNWDQAIEHIRNKVNGATLPKLIDEYNYMKCTKKASF